MFYSINKLNNESKEDIEKNKKKMNEVLELIKQKNNYTNKWKKVKENGNIIIYSKL